MNAFDNTGDSRATVLIIDGTMVDDVRVYEGPVQTLKGRMGTGGNNVPIMAIPIQGTIIGRQDHNGPQGKEFGNETDPMYTLDSVSLHGVAVSYDEYNDSLGGDVPHAIRAGTKQSTGVITAMQVRRLTPTECERLMGWPDNHTLPRADGKQNADTTRYKMCGNGVASPVAQWIGQHLMAITNDQ